MDMIQFAQALMIERSPRGYILIKIRGTKILIIKEMDSSLKESINRMPYKEHIDPWNKAMKALEDEAMAQARKEFKNLAR